MTSTIDRIRAMGSPAEYIHDLLTDLGRAPDFSWQALDDLLRVHYCVELQATVAQQAQEIEDLRDKLHLLTTNF